MKPTFAFSTKLPIHPPPPTVTKDLKCFCGFTVTTFPCGDKSAPTQPPRCVKSCLIKPNCHHPRRKPHRCHFGDCPPCLFVCDQTLEPCQHRCAEPCHDNVAVEIIPTVKRAGPWEKVCMAIGSGAVSNPMKCSKPLSARKLMKPICL